MIRASARLACAVLALALGGFAAGCGADDFSDDAFGVMDLAPYLDGGVNAVPLQSEAQIGYVKGDKVEYYDFGVVPALTDPLTGEPTGARVQSMYFLFDAAGNPLFSEPRRESRGGADWMKGGKNVLDPNPKEFAKGSPEADAQKKLAYPVRLRDPAIDPRRGTNDYQRPIIDFFPGDITPSKPFYTGLWEIVEVTVPDGYTPDSIKSWKTLKRAIEGGSFKPRRTEKAINCPVTDERTSVVTGVSNRPIRHPVIELWYKRKLGFCYLANGWETLGNDDGHLYPANSDNSRLDTFDVNRIKVGSEEGKTGRTELAVPVQDLFIPAHIVPNQDPTRTSTRVRMVKNAVSDAKPRHTEADPPGYTPIFWMWDFVVPSDYVLGTVTSLAQVYSFPAGPRDNRLIIRNYPVRGTITPCSIGKNPSDNLCHEEDVVPDPDQRIITVMDGDKLDAASRTWTFKGGGFTTADLNKHLRVTGAENPDTNIEQPITAVKSATEIVTDSALVFINETLDPAKVKATVFDKMKERKTDKADPRCALEQLECNKESCSCDAPAVGYGKVCGPGLARCKEDKDKFSEFGYTCFPAPVAGNKGFCYVGCNARTPNKTKNEEGQPYRDSRCKDLPNYRCLGFSRTPAEHRFCLKIDCDLADNDPESKQCEALAQPLDPDDPTVLKPDEIDIAKGQVCQDWGLTLCAWNEDYEPK